MLKVWTLGISSRTHGKATSSATVPQKCLSVTPYMNDSLNAHTVFGSLSFLRDLVGYIAMNDVIKKKSRVTLIIFIIACLLYSDLWHSFTILKFQEFLKAMSLWQVFGFKMLSSQHLCFQSFLKYFNRTQIELVLTD